MDLVAFEIVLSFASFCYFVLTKCRMDNQALSN